MRSLVWIALIATFFYAPFLGSVSIEVDELFQSETLSHYIFFELRLPRVILAFLTGMSLALAGLVFQVLFRNALMTPYTLGVSSGAVLGAGIAIKLGLTLTVLGLTAVSIFGFLGALFTVALLLFAASMLRQKESNTLLLMGIALSLFYSAALMVLFYLSDFVETSRILAFTMGSLSIVGYESLSFVAIATLLIVLFIWSKRFELAIVSVSHDFALLKGVDVKALMLTLLLVSSIAIGLIVSITGSIGFIGLVVPHLVARLHKRQTVSLVLPIALFGGLFLVASDVIARIISSNDIPIGIVTAFIGAPFFIYLLLTRR